MVQTAGIVIFLLRPGHFALEKPCFFNKSKKPLDGGDKIQSLHKLPLALQIVPDYFF
jgi:hypothetical protein